MADQEPRPSPWPEVPDRLFVQLGVLILLVAAAWRVVDLSLAPFHHDEGINGWFVTNLARDGRWSYDPANYHGPTLFYFGLASAIAFGLTDEAMRLVPTLFGLGMVVLVLALRPFVGALAALVGAALLAISPGATYVSRYFIHESLVAFFTLAIVVGGLYLLRTSQQRYLVLAVTSAALLFATKETGILHLGVIAIAGASAIVYLRLRARAAGTEAAPPGARRGSGRRPSRRSTSAVPIGAWRDAIRPEGVAWSLAAFLVVYILLFSSFFDNPEGVVDSLATFMIWTQTGTETQVQPFQQYLVWMLQADAPILLLGFVGGLVAAWRTPSVSAVFVGLWALGITLAYSLVSYKTPWIALNMLVPLSVLAGLGIDELGRLLSRSVREVRLPRAAAGAVVAGGLALSAYQAYDINFVRYDDGSYPYVFVHTTRDAMRLVAETRRISGAAGGGEPAGITFVVDRGEYWPLPWYYRDYPQALFYGSIVETEEEMIVARVDQEEDPQLRGVIDGRYSRQGVYNLRPGVDLVLYVRNDLAGL